MKAHEVKPGDRWLDSETLVIYRIEEVRPPQDGRVVVVARYSEQQRTRLLAWDSGQEVPNLTRPER